MLVRWEPGAGLQELGLCVEISLRGGRTSCRQCRLSEPFAVISVPRLSVALLIAAAARMGTWQITWYLGEKAAGISYHQSYLPKNNSVACYT